MLRLLGSPKTLCDGVTRRDLMHIGGLGALGLGLGEYLGLRPAHAESPRPASFGKAKACILLYLYGSPAQYDPVWTRFDGQGTRVVPNLGGVRGATIDFYDPNGRIDLREPFRLDAAGSLPDDVPRDRFLLRRSLLRQFDRARRQLDDDRRVATYSRQQQMAYSLITSPHVRDALDVQREPEEVRERFGVTLFGQATLAARRLVEAGAKFVTVFWDAWKFNNGAWDTHKWHFPRLKQVLLPGFDQAYSALILDLEQRGLLDETLVLCFSEHGRTPKITNTPGGGREHWSRTYWSLLAGAGIARGRVVGRSDAIGGDVVDTPVSPKDILATAYHQLGIDPHTAVPDRLNRPHPIAGDGRFRPEFIG